MSSSSLFPAAQKSSECSGVSGCQDGIKTQTMWDVVELRLETTGGSMWVSSMFLSPFYGGGRGRGSTGLVEGLIGPRWFEFRDGRSRSGGRCW